MLGHTVRSYKITHLVSELKSAASRGTLDKLLAELKKPSLLILDDFGMAPFDVLRCRDLYDVFDDRYDAGAVLITAQLPVSEWHGIFEDPTIADAVLDRVIHRSERIELHGPSRRAQPPVRADDTDNV